MKIFPAIDLYDKKAVRLYKGDYQKAYELFSEYIIKYPNDADARKELEFLSSR